MQAEILLPSRIFHLASKSGLQGMVFSVHEKSICVHRQMCANKCIHTHIYIYMCVCVCFAFVDRYI